MKDRPSISRTRSSNPDVNILFPSVDTIDDTRVECPSPPICDASPEEKDNIRPLAVPTTKVSEDKGIAAVMDF